MAVVYQHKTKDTNEIFYIGIGVVRKRAYSKHGRNKHWKNVVSKHGYYYDIIFDNVTRKEAIEIECYLISYYGRRDLNTGILVNMTGGGDGHLSPNQEQIQKMRERRLGYIHTEETKNRMSEAQKRGRHSHAKRIINIVTGEIFDCIKDGSDKYNIPYTFLKNNLSRTLVNKTDFRFYE